jgi:transcriptional regulator with XRE-family HTH domain
MGMLRAVPPSDDLGLAALGKLIELARRRLGLRLEELAQQMGIDAYELVRIERGSGLFLEPPQLTQVCLLLGLPRRGVMELAGQIGPKGDRVADAAVRFAFGAERREGLSAEEGRALQEFLDSLAEAPDPE